MLILDVFPIAKMAFVPVKAINNVVVRDFIPAMMTCPYLVWFPRKRPYIH